MPPDAGLPAGVLTYAELRALEIGVALGPDPDVLLLDEPTAGMSHGEAVATMELIRAATAGKALVMVEHDMSVVFWSRRPHLRARLWPNSGDGRAGGDPRRPPSAGSLSR